MSTTKDVKTKTSLPIKFVPKGWGFEKWIVNCEGKALLVALP